MCVIVREGLACGNETTGIRYQTKQTYMFNRVLNVSLKWKKKKWRLQRQYNAMEEPRNRN